jgi:hypothetical protein
MNCKICGLQLIETKPNNYQCSIKDSSCFIYKHISHYRILNDFVGKQEVAIFNTILVANIDNYRGMIYCYVSNLAQELFTIKNLTIDMTKLIALTEQQLLDKFDKIKVFS